MLNKKGNNELLIEDRGKKGNGKLVAAFAMVDEVTFGVHTFPTQILVYHSIFLPTLLYNCQSWSNITVNEITKLTTVQLKFLKRILKVPTSTPNAFVFLELGILPIAYELHRRQLGYLWKILNMECNNPILMLYQRMKSLPVQKNWASNILEIHEKYSITLNNVEIKSLSYSIFKNEIIKKLRLHAFNELQKECI